MSPLQDQVIVVTGAGRGLGRAYALDLARRGASIVVNTRPRAADAPGSAEAVTAEIIALGGRAVSAPLAVEEADSGERLLAVALDAFGRLDGLVNNAGAPEAKTLHKQTIDAFRHVFEVNFFGSLTPTLPLYRHLRAQRSGRILMSTSAAGLHGVHGMAAYSSSKAALIGLMRVIALEGASHGVACNAIAPYAATGMTADYLDADSAARMAPERVAPVASWLMAPDCPLNGETLVAGAGRVRPAARIEGPGLAFAADFAPDDLAAHAAALMDLHGWTTFTDGNAAFDQLMAAPLSPTPSK
ncbi:SDR family NAD(P)-dependent oxidoreductase [Brevundimonas diminuta]|uniref:SDR family NAD(P)-dependent oxidoreductase n=1 Tax=Brevundimonas diminuta TaxID=293 RepID=UPI0030FA216D